jgi:chemotaxis protein histidine kinase CheA
MAWRRPSERAGRRQAGAGPAGAVGLPRGRQHPDPHQDDGRGIHRDKVLQRAWERGLVERGVTPPDAEILQPDLRARLLHRREGHQPVGRGVGMDVVRSNIEALRGTVTVSAPRPGQRASRSGCR